MNGDSVPQRLVCSFCGKWSHEVSKLIAGPSALICDECVELSADICGWKLVRPEVERAKVTPKLRYDVLERDGHRCMSCGANAADVVLHVDHITPVCLGGLTTFENLQTLCAPCNLGKGAR